MVVFEGDAEGGEGGLGVVESEMAADPEDEVCPELLLFGEELAEALEELAKATFGELARLVDEDMNADNANGDDISSLKEPPILGSGWSRPVDVWLPRPIGA